jgi:voltage-gated potassium channel Kch
MKKVSLFKYLRYKFDNLMSKGTIAPILLLMFGALTITLTIALLAYITGVIPDPQTVVVPGLDPKDSIGYWDVFRITVLRALDGGVVAEDPVSAGFLALMFAATVGGIIMVSILISIINSGVVRKMNNLRKGISFVVEHDHTVILGWSFQVFEIIKELVTANENQNKMCIAILADMDKVAMEDAIRSKVLDTKNTRVICRTGNPIDIQDLEIVNINEARSIIVLAPETGDPDSNVIKTILAITNNPNRKPLPHKFHIVAEVRDPKNVPIAEIAGKDEVQLVVFDYLISRITAQTCRQPGLSVVFTELLDFAGDEIYFQKEDTLIGKAFIEVLFAYENSVVIGIRKSDGTMMIKPPMTTKFQAGDQLIAISEDDDTVKLSHKTDYGIDGEAIRMAPKYKSPQAERTLILGWNRRAPLIINELDNYVWPGSKITVVSDDPVSETELFDKCADLSHQTVSYWYGDTTSRSILDDLNISEYDHIIVLSQTESSTDIQSTDAKTLNTLLHLRNISDLHDHDFSIVSEMLDDRNRKLAEITHTDDFIVSVKLDSLMLSQISENRELRIVFESLFSAGGPAIYIKPAEHYVELGRPVNFYTIVESARQRNQIAVGYKLKTPESLNKKEHMLAYGVIVNPIKSNQVFFSEGDKIIVIADEEQVG